MKKLFFIGLMAVCLLRAGAATHPLPVVTTEGLELPFGLRWFTEMEAVKEAIVGYGPAACRGQYCNWRRNSQRDLVHYSLAFRDNRLTEFRIIYFIVNHDDRRLYPPEMEKLKQSVQGWEVKDLRMSPGVSTDDRYLAISRDTRMKVEWGEGQSSLSIVIVMQARQ